MREAGRRARQLGKQLFDTLLTWYKTAVRGPGRDQGQELVSDDGARLMATIARVVVEPGRDAIQAMNRLKKILVRGGDWRLVQYRSPDSGRTGHIGPAERRRIKSLRARKRQRKAAAKARAHTAMLERLGLNDRPRRRAAA
jgi:hypothetical protein